MVAAVIFFLSEGWLGILAVCQDPGSLKLQGPDAIANTLPASPRGQAGLADPLWKQHIPPIQPPARQINQAQAEFGAGRYRDRRLTLHHCQSHQL